MSGILAVSRRAVRDALGGVASVRSPGEHLSGAMEWLCRAQDATGDGGVSRSYSLRFMRGHGRRGWLASYPETTGYIIPTFFDHAASTGDRRYRDRAIRMADWEVRVQMESGAVQGGVISFGPTPAVFNTGQVLFGWCRAYRETSNAVYLEAARRAGEFLVEAQDPDGIWRRHSSRYARPGTTLYDARTAWGLAEAGKLTGSMRFVEAACRNLDHVLGRQQANGWYPDCCLDDPERPLLHTIAYTMEGLLEAGVLLERPDYVGSARRAADALLGGQRADGGLAGRFDAKWRPVTGWSCLTGDAQTALVWIRLFQQTGEPRYLAAARALNRFVAGTQDLTATDPGVRGGVKGSHPIWGDYAPFEYLNWAAKFFADSLRAESRVAGGEVS